MYSYLQKRLFLLVGGDCHAAAISGEERPRACGGALVADTRVVPAPFHIEYHIVMLSEAVRIPVRPILKFSGSLHECENGVE